MAKILVIQFRINENSVKQEQGSIRRGIPDTIDLEFINAIDDNYDWHYPETIMKGFDGVILGGSGDLDFDGNRSDDDPVRKISYEVLGRLRPLFQYIFDNDIPTLGICYGHQILGAFAGAQVRYSKEQSKIKSHEVKLMVDKNDYFLFSDLPDAFQAHYGHKDVLDRVPEGATLLMNGGDSCKISALKYKQNVYTVQFHPELTFDDMLERIKVSPGYLPEGIAVEEVFKNDSNSNKILRNFGHLVENLALNKQGDIEEVSELVEAVKS